MINKLKALILFIACLSVYSYGGQVAGTVTATVAVAPIVATVEQLVGSSLSLSQVNGSSLVALYMREFKPQVWVTNTGSSVTSFAFSAPSTGSSLGGQTDLFGGSLVLPMSWRFHAPSIYPSYGSSVQVGTQTYSVGGQMTMSDGTIIYPTSTTIKVNPMTLPSSQVSGWH